MTHWDPVRGPALFIQLGSASPRVRTLPLRDRGGTNRGHRSEVGWSVGIHHPQFCRIPNSRPVFHPLYNCSTAASKPGRRHAEKDVHNGTVRKWFAERTIFHTLAHHAPTVATLADQGYNRAIGGTAKAREVVKLKAWAQRVCFLTLQSPSKAAASASPSTFVLHSTGLYY